MRPSPTPHSRIDQQAADWFVRLDDRTRSLSAREQARWLAWLQRSPRHLESFMSVAELYDRLEGIDRDSHFDVVQWLQQRRGETLDIGTRFTPRPPNAARPAWQSALRSRITAIAACVSLVTVAAVSWWALSTTERYRTELGEQRTVQLTDGSTIQLNTQSTVRVSLGEHSRVIELEGEATFTVAHDATRPFLVKTHDATTQAVGTKFNVYQENGRTRVAVVEGVVVVTPLIAAAVPVEPQLARSLTIVAGDVVEAAAGRVERADGADAAAAISWQQHRLIFKDTALAEIARQFNRYNSVRIDVAPVPGANIQLSGTFDAKQPETLIRYLQDRDDVIVRRDGDHYRLESK